MTSRKRNAVHRRAWQSGLAGGAVAGTSLPLSASAEAPISPELLTARERLLAARAEQDRLLKIARGAMSNRPPVPESIERQDFKGLHHGPQYWRRRGRADLAHIAEVYEAAVDAADVESDYWAHNERLDATMSVINNLESEMVAFEPRTIAELRLQVELAYHQEVVDHGMFGRLPLLICERFLRLTPALTGSR